MPVRSDLLGILDVDPDLGRGIDPKEIEQARRLVVARRETLMPGHWDVQNSLEIEEPPFAALVVDGLMTRDRSIGTSLNTEVFGPGDLIEPWSADDGMVPTETGWTATVPTTLALLDHRFLTAVGRWPILALRLFDRQAEQNARISMHATINGIRNVEQRILAMLWHLAGLYGKVQTEGKVLLPLQLSHQAIGRLVAAARPTVTLAMKRLIEEDMLSLDDRGGFLLRDASRTTLTPGQNGNGAGRITGITNLEPLHRLDRNSDSERPPVTRDLGRLQEQVSVLRDAESGLRAIFELSAIGVAKLEAQSGELLNVNDRLAEILSSSKRSLLGTSLWEHLSPHERVRVADSIAPLIANRRSQAHLELQLTDEEQTWLRASFAVLDAEDAVAVQLIAAFEDITGRKRAEITLRERDEGLTRELDETRILQAVSSLPIEDDDPDAIFEEVVRAARLFMHSDAASFQRLTPEKDRLELIGWEGFHPDSAAHWKLVDLADDTTVCASALRHGRRIIAPDVHAEESEVDAPDLAEYDRSGLVAVQSTPLTSREGETLGMISTHWREQYEPTDHEFARFDVLARQAADVLVQTRARKALLLSEERLAAVFEDLPAGVGIFDVDGNVVRSNQEWERFMALGVIPSSDPSSIERWRSWDADGRPIGPDDFPGARALRGEDVSSGLEFVYTDDDGKETWTRVASVPIRDGSGRVTGAFTVITDIDMLKRDPNVPSAHTR